MSHADRFKHIYLWLVFVCRSILTGKLDKNRTKLALGGIRRALTTRKY